MTDSKATLDEHLAALKTKVFDEFSQSAIEGARHALADTENPMRLNFFSTAMRILFEHAMATLAPPEQVVQCSWFTPETKDGKPSRGQRIVYAIQGGLADAFVKGRLAVDVAPLRKKLVGAVDKLSKHVHGREDTIVQDTNEQDVEAQSTIEALGNFLEAYRDCRAAILGPIQEELDDAAVDALISETIIEVDELATHHSIEEIHVDDIVVKEISPTTIIYRAEGSISVILQWGSNSDLERGDGAQAADSFRFHCDIEMPLDEPWDLHFAETSYFVDTREWRDDWEPDE